MTAGIPIAMSACLEQPGWSCASSVWQQQQATWVEAQASPGLQQVSLKSVSESVT